MEKSMVKVCMISSVYTLRCKGRFCIIQADNVYHICFIPFYTPDIIIIYMEQIKSFAVARSYNDELLMCQGITLQVIWMQIKNDVFKYYISHIYQSFHEVKKDYTKLCLALS